VRLVSMCDKLHNARSMLADYRRIGERLWDRFNGGRDGTLWYYAELLQGYRQALTDSAEPADSPMWSVLDELQRTVRAFESLMPSAR
jgi:hypothetical protein